MNNRQESLNRKARVKDSKRKNPSKTFTASTTIALVASMVMVGFVGLVPEAEAQIDRCENIDRALGGPGGDCISIILRLIDDPVPPPETGAECDGTLIVALPDCLPGISYSHPGCTVASPFVCYDTGNSVLYFWDGSTWRSAAVPLPGPEDVLPYTTESVPIGAYYDIKCDDGGGPDPATFYVGAAAGLADVNSYDADGDGVVDLDGCIRTHEVSITFLPTSPFFVANYDTGSITSPLLKADPDPGDCNNPNPYGCNPSDAVDDAEDIVCNPTTYYCDEGQIIAEGIALVCNPTTYQCDVETIGGVVVDTACRVETYHCDPALILAEVDRIRQDAEDEVVEIVQDNDPRGEYAAGYWYDYGCNDGGTHEDVVALTTMIALDAAQAADDDADGDGVPAGSGCLREVHVVVDQDFVVKFTNPGDPTPTADPDDSDCTTPNPFGCDPQEPVWDAHGDIMDLYETYYDEVGRIAAGLLEDVEDVQAVVVGYVGNAEDLAVDPDGDGYTNDQEVNDGSHPLYADSTPYTDDDGDGQQNRETDAVFYPRSMFTGAFGVVAWNSFSDYGGSFPGPGCELMNSESQGAYFFCVNSDDEIWLWDPVCLPGAVGDYEPCKNGNYDADPAIYSGDFVSDGYGWRHVGDVPNIFPRTFDDVPVPCTADGSPFTDANDTQDQDGDGSPVVHVCIRDVTVETDGTVSEGSYTNEYSFGDPDDQDHNDPVPFDDLDGYYYEVNSTTAFVVNAAWEQVGGMMGDVDALAEDVEALRSYYQDLATNQLNASEEDFWQRYAEVEEFSSYIVNQSDEFESQVNQLTEGSQSYLLCIQKESDEYILALETRVNAFVADGTPAKYEAVENHLTDGLTALVLEYEGCREQNPTELQPLVEAAEDALFEAVGESVETTLFVVEGILANEGNITKWGQTVLGITSETFDAFYGVVQDIVLEADRQVRYSIELAEQIDDRAGTNIYYARDSLAQPINRNEEEPRSANATTDGGASTIEEVPLGEVLLFPAVAALLAVVVVVIAYGGRRR